MSLPEINKEYLLKTLNHILNIPSPTGYTHDVVDFLVQDIEGWEHPGLSTQLTNKGALIVTWAGECNDRPRALTAHVDTLGGMVKEVKPNGRLKLTNIGSFAWNTIEGVGCMIIASNGNPQRGSILLSKASSHVYGTKVGETKRDAENMEVRIDARTTTAEETQSLGIEVGDFISFDPRVEQTDGFIRSRHLDDKAGVVCVLAALRAMTAAQVRPTQTTTFHFSNYEEVGHGAAAGLPADLAELVAVDMAAIGEGQTSDEFHATICVKDSGGPYHHDLSNRLRSLAEKHEIPYKVDIYPYYGSDGEAYWRAGGDVAVALIGPGVDASHNYERTHVESLDATTNWIMAYLLDS
jgi:putative aminopeptidase FrvX